MREVAGLDGIVRAPLGTSDYWRRLEERLAGADKTKDRASLSEALAGIGARAGTQCCRSGHATATGRRGTWQGRVTACSSGTGRGSAPMCRSGFDALHHWLQGKIQTPHPDPRASAVSCVERAPTILAPLEVEAGEAESRRRCTWPIWQPATSSTARPRQGRDWEPGPVADPCPQQLGRQAVTVRPALADCRDRKACC